VSEDYCWAITPATSAAQPWPIRFRCAGVWISNGLPCVCVCVCVCVRVWGEGGCIMYTRQDCPLSPILFNTHTHTHTHTHRVYIYIYIYIYIYVYEIITDWKGEEIRLKGIKTPRNEDIKTICLRTTKLKCQIQSTHYKFVYINWRHLPPNVDEECQQAKLKQWLLEEVIQ